MQPSNLILHASCKLLVLKSAVHVLHINYFYMHINFIWAKFCSQMRNYCAKNRLVSCWSQSKKTTWNGNYSLMKPLSMCLGMLTAFMFRYGVLKTHDMWRCSWQSKAKYVVHNRVKGPCFFYEKAITWGVWLDKLCVVPELEELQLLVIFKQDGMPPYE
jgi:hypothetical protein